MKQELKEIKACRALREPKAIPEHKAVKDSKEQLDLLARKLLPL